MGETSGGSIYDPTFNYQLIQTEFTTHKIIISDAEYLINVNIISTDINNSSALVIEILDTISNNTFDIPAMELPPETLLIVDYFGLRGSADYVTLYGKIINHLQSISKVGANQLNIIYCGFDNGLPNLEIIHPRGK